MSAFKQGLDELTRGLEELEAELGKRSKPLDDDGDDHEYEQQMDQLTDDEGDPDTDPDQDQLDNGELDPDDDQDQDPPLSLRNNRQRLGKSYGQVDSSTIGSDAAPPVTHKFESKIRYIQSRDGCSASEAASRARKENPTLYESYLKSGLAKGSNGYWAKVQQLMFKGDSQTTAEQKVLHAYGNNLALPDVNKSADVVDFMKRVDRVMAERPSLSRVDAMRVVRKRFPGAYSRFQNVR